ncbi:MAG: M48 family metalloprotease [Candidatus Aminicenantes bacterium]|nr:M48 family metalloprotease [Candidatus Aminicenantes bacterium]
MNARARSAFGFLLAVILAFGGCSIIDKGAEIMGKAGDAIDKGDKVVKAYGKLRSAFGDFTEEEEYYIGRSVAALILGRYPALDNAALNQYVAKVGNAVALFSDRPEIYAGWHFQVLNTDEVNALAAPGGMIFITKGLLKRCPDEESLALILAHEVGHVAAKHGLQSIRKANLTGAFTSIGIEAIKTYGPAQLSQITAAFEGVLSDVVGTLIERGYDRKFEYEADESAVLTGCRTGYDPAGITRFLATMVGDKTTASGKGWFKTHPSPEQRIDRVDSEIIRLRPVPSIAAIRTQRFKAAVASVR